jgi:hypothetical protein
MLGTLNKEVDAASCLVIALFASIYVLAKFSCWPERAKMACPSWQESRGSCCPGEASRMGKASKHALNILETGRVSGLVRSIDRNN